MSGSLPGDPVTARDTAAQSENAIHGDEAARQGRVTALRSPSGEALEVRMFSARCLGVQESGPASFAGESSETVAAH